VARGFNKARPFDQAANLSDRYVLGVYSMTPAGRGNAQIAPLFFENTAAI
jgi:hypothetical protein